MNDPVNSPSHYPAVRGVEVQDVIEALELNHWSACAFEYIWRAGRKEGSTEVFDLEKAVWFLERRIKQLRLGEEPNA